MGPFARMPESLLTERLLLRPWADADAAVYRQLWGERDARSLRVIGADGRPTTADLRIRIRHQLAESARTGFGLMVVERRDRSDVIGYCGLIDRDVTPDEPELAFEFLRSTHGLGYATEAARAVRDAAAATGRCRLWAGVRVWNTASIRVLDKLGFDDSGQMHRDAVRGDMIVMTCCLTTPT